MTVPKTNPRQLGGLGLLAVVGLAALLLPLVPTWAQQSGKELPRISNPQLEGDKININALMAADPTGKKLYDALMTLPNMTPDIASSIVYWVNPAAAPPNAAQQPKDKDNAKTDLERADQKLKVMAYEIWQLKFLLDERKTELKRVQEQLRQAEKAGAENIKAKTGGGAGGKGGGPGFVQPDRQVAKPPEGLPMLVLKLPQGLPHWFVELDTDKDGQVGLWEWRQAGKPVAEFVAMDLNGDGFLTAEEVLTFQDNRLADLERKLNAILQEVREMRKVMGKAPNPMEPLPVKKVPRDPAQMDKVKFIKVLGAFKLGEVKTINWKLASDKPFRILAVKVDGLGVNAEFSQDSAEDHNLTIRCQSESLGDFQRTLFITIDLGNDQRILALTVQGTVVP